ncbi:MOSC domain-containing protein [Egibacter rhizosphaerae]|uniref:MOSC domain-containing protein n=1 Tax=Egibacter rhizosphaerae TaxID=1670831 RepID=A0A411YIS4_9ACTN|nr:MOSC N-terminal beta barrel domain-containing protein [Egibacter rhizosphaerae]QBI21051.1 MOSC domain-containing protein [Egibacter rhizosphaerae]
MRANGDTMAAVARLSTAAVKGTALTHPDAVELTAGGARGDRVVHLIDERGRLVNGKQAPPLATVHSRLDGDELTLELPEGDVVTGPLALAEQVTTSFYGRPVPGRIVAGSFADALSEVAGRAVRLVRPAYEVAAVDAAPVSLVSRATLAAFRVASDGPEVHWADRFRILVEIDGVDGREEETWQGEHIAVGEAVIEIDAPIPRCSVTTVDPARGVSDFDTLARLRDWRDDGEVTLGMWGSVVRPGRVTCGDTVSIASSPSDATSDRGRR